MSTPLAFVSAATLQALGWTLVHFLWQGIVVFLLLESTMQFVRTRSPQVRYAASCVALFLMLLMPLATFRAELGAAQRRLAPRFRTETLRVPPATATVEGETHHAGTTLAYTRPGAATQTRYAPERARNDDVQPKPRSVGSPWPERGKTSEANRTATAWTQRLHLGAVAERVEALLPWLVAVWFVGVVFLLARLVGGWSQAQRLRLEGLVSAPNALQCAVDGLRYRLGVRQAVRVFESAVAEVPTVVGWMKPIILIPTSALAGLSPQQLEAILAHELAHVRRHDYVVNLMQTVVETLLFYHPAVWWISQRIREEREHCCDDLAVRVCGDRFGYVRALTALEELRAQPSNLGVAMAANGGSLLARVQRLLGRRNAADASPARGVAGFLAVAIVFLLGVGMQRVGEAGAETEPWNSKTASAPAASQSPAARPASPSAFSAETKNVLGPRSARKGEAQPASQLRPARSNMQPPRAAADEAADHDSRRRGRVDSATLSVRQLLALRQAGVDADYVESMRSAWDHLDVDDLIALRINGVDAAFVDAMHAAFPDLDAGDVLTLRRLGVDRRYVEAMRQISTDWDASEICYMLQRGIDPAWVERMHDACSGSLDADELIALRQYGVDADWVQALRDAGLEDFDVEELIDLRQQGAIASNWRQVQEDMCPSDSDNDNGNAKSNRNSNRNSNKNSNRNFNRSSNLNANAASVSGGARSVYAEKLRVLGLEDLGADELIELRRNGVNARYIADMVEAGLEPSVDVLVHLRRNGVKPQHIRAIRDGDAAALTVRDLVKLKNAGIDGAVLDRLQEAKR